MSRKEIAGEIERIRQIYCLDVLKDRTREVELPGRKCSARIQQTFLGYEVKAGRKRITCPDEVSARYLKIFAEIGFKSICIPYDPTRTAVMVTGLEGALARIQELLSRLQLDSRRQQVELGRIYRRIRKACECSGD